MSSKKNQHDTLSIGQLARAADVNVETIRYYHRIGLVEQPALPASGYRRYPARVLQQLLFIKRAQKLGFSLQEISELLQLSSGSCMDVRQRAEQRREKINRQIKDLQALSDILGELIDECKQESSENYCPIIESLLTAGETGA